MVTPRRPPSNINNTIGRQQMDRFATIANTLLGPSVQTYGLPTAETVMGSTAMKLLGSRGPITSSARKLYNSTYGISDSGGGGSVTGSPWGDQVALGNASPEVKKAWETYQNSKARASVGLEGAQKKSSGIMGALTSVAKLPGVKETLGGLARVGDIISRPGYAVENMMMESLKDFKKGDILESFGVDPRGWGDYAVHAGKGIWGTEKTRGSQILKEAGMKKNLLRGILGLGLDIGTDPLTYVAPGVTAALDDPIKVALGKAGIVGKEADLIAGELPNIQRQIGRGPARGAKRLTSGEITSAGRFGLRERLSRVELGAEGQAVRQAAEDAARASGKQLTDIKNAGNRAVNTLLKSEAEAYHGQLQTALEPLQHLKPTFRLGILGKHTTRNLLPDAAARTIQKGGTASFEFMKNFGPTANVIERAQKMFQFEKAFPGHLQELRNAARGGGVVEHEKLEQQLNNLFRHISPEQDKLLSKALQDGTDLTGSFDKAGRPLEEIKQEAAKIMDDQFQAQVKLGLRKQSDYVKGYAPAAFRNVNDRKAALKWLQDRKAVFKNPGVKVAPAEYTTMAAKEAGYKPVERLSDQLMYASKNHNLDVTKHWWRTEVFNRYGVPLKTLAHPDAIDMVKIADDSLPDTIKATLKEGEHMYLPKNIHEGFDSYDSMLRLYNEEELHWFVNMVDKTNRAFKLAKTVPNPAYHINNMLGDMWFSWLNGTPVTEYIGNLRRWSQAKYGEAADSIKLAGGHEVGWEEARQLYSDHAGGRNFFSTETPRSVPLGGDVRRHAARGVQWGRDLSEVREDWGRFNNFTHSYKEEFDELAKGKTLTGKALEDAKTEAAKRAARRVNKYNFDYSALAPFEQKWMKRVAPFYTFARKATPLLFENMYLSPGRILATEKAKNAIATMLGTDDGTWDTSRLPAFLREGGAFAMLNHDEEPWVLNLSNNPMYSLTSPLGIPEDQGSATSSALSRLTPFFTMPVEVATKKSLFTGAPVKNWQEELQRTFLPSKATTNLIPGVGDKPFSERLAEATGQFKHITSEQQVAALKRSTELLNPELSKQNKQNIAKGFEIKTIQRKAGNVYRIVSGVDGRNLGEYPTKAAAQAAANEIPSLIG